LSTGAELECRQCTDIGLGQFSSHSANLERSTIEEDDGTIEPVEEETNKWIPKKRSEQVLRKSSSLFRSFVCVSDVDDLCKEAEEADIDKQVNALFDSTAPRGARRVIREDLSEKSKQDKVKEASEDFRPARVQPRSRSRRATEVGGSICLGSLRRPSDHNPEERKIILAMKCLRPQIQSNADQFQVAINDLAHETAMLASLDHPNIIKIHGRAGGRDSNSFRLSEDFFILLDRLTETLEERMHRWKNLSNVGFDSTGGILKLFDFGFAVGLDEPPGLQSTDHGGSWDGKESDLLYERCGTPRYMAPEVGLDLGYHSLSADVYSFGILLCLRQICSLKKPFCHVKSEADLQKSVFEKNSRPKLQNHCPQELLRELMTSCWSSSPNERPEIWYVKTVLSAHVRDASMPPSPSSMPDHLSSSLSYVEWTSGDVFDERARYDAMSGIGVVVFCVGAFGSNEYMLRACGDATIAAITSAPERGITTFGFSTLLSYVLLYLRHRVDSNFWKRGVVSPEENRKSSFNMNSFTKCTKNSIFIYGREGSRISCVVVRARSPIK
jgi:hypothetical protein